MENLNDTLSPMPNGILSKLIVGTILLVILRALYRIYLHPLSHIPGPWLAAVSSTWFNVEAFVGRQGTATQKMHDRYGPIVRIGPNDVDISDGDALHTAYAVKNGFAKAACYANFDLDGHSSLFSETIPQARDVRSKAIVPMLSMSVVRKRGSEHFRAISETFVSRIVEERAAGFPVNILNLARSWAADITSVYLFDSNYDSLYESGNTSMNGILTAAYPIYRTFYLPWTLCQTFDYFANGYFASKEVREGLEKLNKYIATMIDRSGPGKEFDDNFPARLMKVGISRSEAASQCKDLMFGAGLGINLATACYMLAKHPPIYEKLRKEVTERPEGADFNGLPYLQMVVKETLRVSRVNPTRLPRQVPSEGWTFKGTHLPGGTTVSCTALVLTFDPDVYDSPYEFRPERWENSTEQMVRNLIPFGAGTRGCPGKNVAHASLYEAIGQIAEKDILRGATCCSETLEIYEYFNCKFYENKIELKWQ